MKLNNGLEVKREYFEYIKNSLSDESIDAEDAIEFVYSKYNDTILAYEESKKFCFFTKANFVKTFVRLFENIGPEVFEMSTSTFVKCVSLYMDDEDHVFTNLEIETLDFEPVWTVFCNWSKI